MEGGSISDYSICIRYYMLFYNDQGEFPYWKQREYVIKNKLKTFTINWNHLYTWFEQNKDKCSVNFALLLLKDPVNRIPELSRYVYEVLAHDYVEENGELKPKLDLNDYGNSIDITDFQVVLTDIPNKKTIREILAENTQPGTLVEVKGVVVAKVNPKPKVKVGHYVHESAECDGEFDYDTEDVINGSPTPTICPVCKKSGRFKLIPQKSVYVSWQKITIQELPEEVPPGEIPRPIDIELPDYLIDRAKIGDRISVVGLVMVKPDMRKVNGQLISNYYIKANSLKVLESTITDYQLTKEDEEKVKELAKDPQIVDKIIKSIAPSLYGLELEKEMIGVSLFGGVERYRLDGTRIRGEIHALIIGDPGTGKSQLLMFVKKLMPRANYVDCKNATGVGLTGTVELDSDTGEWRTVAGAIALADRGILLLDEFDKLDKEGRQSLNVAMEQGIVKIDKADQHVELHSRATIIAVGNPKFIRYRDDLSLAENISFTPDTLSRFDLISIVTDKPDLEKDNALVEHRIKSELNKNYLQDGVIDIDTLRKYIIYARYYVKPEFTEEALRMLATFWVETRNKLREVTDFPMEFTKRQLEALERIAQAYAKMRLSNKVEIQDVERAINLYKKMLSKLRVDLELGMEPTMYEKIVGVWKIIDAQSYSPTTDYCAKLSDIITNAEEELGITTVEIEKIVNYLRQSGKIHEKKRKDGSTCYSTK